MRRLLLILLIITPILGYAAGMGPGPGVKSYSAGDVTPPEKTSLTIPSAGTTLLLGLSETCSIGAGGNGGLTLSMSGGAVTASYSSGSGSNTFTYNLSRTVNSGETGTASYTQPGNGIEDTAGNDLASFSSQAVTNNSTQSGGGTALCSSCTPGDPSDVLCDDFENADTLCSWSISQDGTGAVSLTSTRNQSSLACTNKGTYNADFSVSGTYQDWSNGAGIGKTFAAKTTLYVQFYLYIESEGIEDGQVFDLINLSDAEDTHNRMWVGFRQNSGVLQLSTFANDFTTGPTIGITDLSTGIWYRIGVEYTANTAGGGKVYINGIEETSCAIDTPNNSVERAAFGIFGSTARYQIDNLQIDDDTMPEACP
jgi:hypothetical protein